MITPALLSILLLIAAYLKQGFALSTESLRTPPLATKPQPGTVVVVGGGFIGSSFCAVYLASGKRVVCSDPFVSEADLKKRIETVWPTVRARGIGGKIDSCPKSPPCERLSFESSVETALRENPTQFVQECTIEDIESKQEVLARLDELLADQPSTIISSSTSYIPHELLITKCKHHKDRVLVGHPTIPYLDSFLEIYGTSQAHVNAAQAWYSQAGFEAVVMKKTIPGHLFNSFLTMNMRHGNKLVKDGVCTPQDVNVVLRHLGRFMYARHGYLSLLSTIGGDRGLKGGMDLSAKIKMSAISIVFYSLLKKVHFFFKGSWVRRIADFMAKKLQDKVEPPPAQEWIEACGEFEAQVTKNGTLSVPTGLFQACEPMFQRTPYEVGNDPFAIEGPSDKK
ncbi:L-carnitine dehydrogenase [Seminavis robusta]|uniref:L-carnitine dehydrogenase n=1 Tax=Seminavis robusta TaxID=568900 RepID=A0A9N8HT06_9STRA|nr:L-carnitine dehydrogenase [Seminavis robusta]|eukprot:Sro1802_g298580.1 L-carnitine dehydrogenase (396) ;mRNA; r:15284-16471